MTIDGKVYVAQVKKELNDEVKGVGRNLWAGVLASAGTGFGKGVLIMAGIAAVGLAIAFGFQAYTGMIAAGALKATVSEGVAIGVRAVPSFLTSGMGLSLLAVGGALGAVADVKKEHGRISADLAKAQAREFELVRKLDHAQETGVVNSRDTRSYQFDNPEAHCNHCAAEEMRRNSPPSQNRDYDWSRQ